MTAIKSGIQDEVSGRCDRIAKELQTSQNKQIQDLQQEMLHEIAKVPTLTESTHQKSLLRPEAPLFTPLGNEATKTPTAACGGGGATQETTKCSPAMLQFGHELRLPVDLLLGRPEEAATTTDYCELLQERLEQAHSYARENLNISMAQAMTCVQMTSHSKKVMQCGSTTPARRWDILLN